MSVRLYDINVARMPHKILLELFIASIVQQVGRSDTDTEKSINSLCTLFSMLTLRWFLV